MEPEPIPEEAKKNFFVRHKIFLPGMRTNFLFISAIIVMAFASIFVIRHFYLQAKVQKPPVFLVPPQLREQLTHHG